MHIGGGSYLDALLDRFDHVVGEEAHKLHGVSQEASNLLHRHRTDVTNSLPTASSRNSSRTSTADHDLLMNLSND